MMSILGGYLQGHNPRNHTPYPLNNFLSLSEVPVINGIYLGKKHGPLKPCDG